MIFLLCRASGPALGLTHPIQWVLGGLSQGVKQPRCETDDLPLSSVKVKNMWCIPPLPDMSP